MIKETYYQSCAIAMKKKVLKGYWEVWTAYAALGDEITDYNFVYDTSSNTAALTDDNYTVTYKNNDSIGTATVIVTGKGEYVGTKKATFKIQRRDLKKESELLNGLEGLTADKAGEAPKLNLVFDGRQFVEGRDYTVICKNNSASALNKGKTPTVTIKGKGNYSGKVTETFVVNP